MRKSGESSALALFGGEPLIKKPFRRHQVIGRSEIKAVRAVMKSGVLSQFLGTWSPDFFGGPRVIEFEQKCCEYFGSKHSISVNSWTSGLIAAVGAIGIEPGDEVIVSPWTMSATAMAILHWNAIPVFVDINEENFCINPKLIESKITQRTRAILSVDIFGNSADMNEIMRIAKKHNLTVISDSAQSPGAKHKGRNAGTISHIGGISLNYHKHIHTGEGGVLFTENDELANRMRLIRNHAESVVEGMGQSDLTNMVGFNFRLGEIEAAIGIQQLKKLEEIIAKKQSIANKLTEELSPLQGIKLPKIQNQLEHVYYVYPIILEPSDLGVSRERIFNALKSEGLINISEGYVNVHLLPIFQKKIAFGKNGFPWVTTSGNSNVSYQKGICPVAERLHDETYLSIGLGGLDLSEKDVKKIGATFRKVWANLDQLK